MIPKAVVLGKEISVLQGCRRHASRGQAAADERCADLLMAGNFRLAVGLRVLLAASSGLNQSCRGGPLPHSDRDGTCAGDLGEECPYRCDGGFLAVGRQVCQADAKGNATFSGGRCVRLCASAGAQNCSVPLRWASRDAGGACLATRSVARKLRDSELEF